MNFVLLNFVSNLNILSNYFLPAHFSLTCGCKMQHSTGSISANVGARCNHTISTSSLLVFFIIKNKHHQELVK
ncbi:hypothetical protein VNO80_28337 [Phaseolus coccineus]|uniref:Uncharacterized protein n=1 Tax=Phaseolus coccineus TaxID=3886 RepID=A0AAN9L8V6_PHACN